MNEYEYLYEKKKLIEEDIKKHKLFKLSKKEAIHYVMIKVGMFCSIFRAGVDDNKQKYLKKLASTNATMVNGITFIQESLKWICRWCSAYCVEESEYKEEVSANEIYELMGMAYTYEIFNRYYFFHSKQIVKYQCHKNIIEFNYVYEENHQIHELYDTLVLISSEENNYVNVIMNRKCKTDIELIEMIHRADFDLYHNFEFGEFCLKEYEEFSVALNNYVINKRRRPHIAIPGKEGVICLNRQEWIDMLVKSTGLQKNTVEAIIDFFQYDFEDTASDLSLTYFFQQDKDEILLSEDIFNIQRPATNALRLLAKRKSKLYESEQNKFEAEQKKKVIKIIGNKYEVANNLTKEQQLRSGMDMLVYDKENKHLQVVELKYKIPIESARDIINLDEMLNKAYSQIVWAENYVKKNSSGLLEEYFGNAYCEVVPETIDFFVLTNYSIGSGDKCKLPSPILLEEHYLRLMQLENGMKYVHEALIDKGKGCIGKVEKRYARYVLPNCKFKIPETLTKK